MISEWENLVSKVGDDFKEMLDYYDVDCLEDLTLQEVKEYLINVLNK